ncbi:uncharacterized protein LOC111269476 isoform X2 [Varroa jacobsoni]|uniref:uncharacterized protein LOC111269476 isoform X2 n=1 Tax=Varroa jacobsoni TaxID=62625 RepID=UPI000BF95D06|nr:uncharacterized protein LOC111269476 isoform X2 [Varroa jacobsoni]
MENEETKRAPSPLKVNVTKKLHPPASAIPLVQNREEGFILSRMARGDVGLNHITIENNWMDDLLVIVCAACCTIRFTDLSYYIFFGTHQYAAMTELDIKLAVGDDVIMACLAITMFSSVVFPYKRWAVFYYFMGFVSLGLQLIARDGPDFLPKEQWKIDFLEEDIRQGYIVAATSIDVVGNSRTAMKYTIIATQVDS